MTANPPFPLNALAGTNPAPLGVYVGRRVTHCARCGDPLDAETTTARVIERSVMHADCWERDQEDEP